MSSMRRASMPHRGMGPIAEPRPTTHCRADGSPDRGGDCTAHVVRGRFADQGASGQPRALSATQVDDSIGIRLVNDQRR